ncbi:MAG: phosphoglycerate mutase [Actinomycetota bacterium]|nr:MAG: phosphoglycerate mutase [Actinomycetota bacterium]
MAGERRILYLVRHGRADQTARIFRDGPRGPTFDPPLDAVGREQARLLAQRLLRLDPQPSVVACSPLRRALETVAPYAEAAGAEVEVVEDLAEAHLGEWEHLTFEEILATDEEVVERLRNQEAIWQRAPGGERLPEFRARVVRAIEGLLAANPAGDVLVVAHGGVINAYVGSLLGIDHEMFFLPENTSLNSVVVEGERRRVRFLNDVLHLTDPDLFAAPAPGPPQEAASG